MGSKTDNPNITIKNGAKKRSPKRSFKASYLFYRKTPIPESIAEKKFLECLDVAEKEEDVLTIEETCYRAGLPRQTFYRFIDNYSSCKEIYQNIKLILSFKRENGGLRRELDSGMVSKSMPIYSKEWKENEERQAFLKQQANTPDKDVLKEIYEEFMRDYNAKV